MTKVYIVRHCEAMGNVMRLFQGTTDTDITETGAKQLKHLKKRFADINIDKVYTSPLIRARKTALAVIGDRSLIPIPEKGLIELDGGIVEGKPFKETFEAIPDLADAWDNHPEDFAPEGGEKMRDAYERIWNTVKGIAAENSGKTVVCSTHGGVTRCLMCRLLTGDIKNLSTVPWSDNTAVALIEFDENLKPRLLYFNDVSHLPQELIPRRSRLSAFMGKE